MRDAVSLTHPCDPWGQSRVILLSVRRLLVTWLACGALVAPAAATPPGFTTAAGVRTSLAAFHGHPVLVDLWASWCAPCLPRLAELQRIADRFGPRGLVVVPLSLDRGGAPAALRVYARLGLSRLPLYLGDPMTTLSGFGARRLPTTILFDGAGREVARSEGDAAGADPLPAAIERLLPPCSEGPCR